jgi:hypothetical protein
MSRGFSIHNAARYIRAIAKIGKGGGITMKGTSLLGLALIVLGVIALVYQGISYTTHKKVVDIGPIEATKEEHKTIPLPPILGVIALAGGIFILARDRK